MVSVDVKHHVYLLHLHTSSTIPVPNKPYGFFVGVMHHVYLLYTHANTSHVRVGIAEWAEPWTYIYVYIGPWVGGAGIAQWLEHRTRDWKVAGSNPCWNGGRIFFSRVDFLCWLLFRYPFHPRVTAVARKKSRSFCQKCRWQVTAKTRIHLTYVDFIEPCFGIGHNLSLICQMTSEDIKHQLIIITMGRASGPNVRRNTDAGSSPRCGKWFFSQSQLPVQTVLRCPYSPRVQPHASTSVYLLQIPNTGSRTHRNTAHTDSNG